MRTLYLIRHAEPQRPPGPHRCVSRTDAPLSAVGMEQAAALQAWGLAHPVEAVYCSPALRCRQTAQALAPASALRIRGALQEVCVGEWENRTFEEIRRRWPAEYAARGEHLGTAAPPGGESFLQAGGRFYACICEILDETSGDVAIVAHGGVLRGWLCGLLGADPDRIFAIRQPWCGVTTVRCGERGRGFSVAALGCQPAACPGPEAQRALLARCGTPQPVQAHCRAVARQALRLAPRAPAPVDTGLLQSACLLHDMCRADGREHPARAAALLEQEGYPRLAEIVAQHHDLGQTPTPEAELLYLADKLVLGAQPAPLHARFAAAREKCTTPQALAAWQRRYDAALRLAARYLPEAEAVDMDKEKRP